MANSLQALISLLKLERQLLQLRMAKSQRQVLIQRGDIM